LTISREPGCTLFISWCLPLSSFPYRCDLRRGRRFFRTPSDDWRRASSAVVDLDLAFCTETMRRHEHKLRTTAVHCTPSAPRARLTSHRSGQVRLLPELLRCVTNLTESNGLERGMKRLCESWKVQERFWILPHPRFCIRMYRMSFESPRFQWISRFLTISWDFLILGNVET